MRILGFEITRKRIAEGEEVHKNGNTPVLEQSPVLTTRPPAIVGKLSDYLEVFSPAACYRNYAFMFHNIAEVQFPIMYVSRRISSAKFVLRKSSDDTVVWADSARGLKDRYVANIIEKGLLNRPNPYCTFKDFVMDSFINKFLFGNMYIYAYADKDNGRLWETCNEYYVLQSNSVSVDTKWSQYIGGYGNVTYRYSDAGVQRVIPQELMYHLIDLPSFSSSQYGAITGRSRLDALKYPISNIIAVYEARNAIYVKRGALGLIVNQTRDEAGSLALSPNEKDAIKKEFEVTYGIGEGKSPVAFMNRPVTYVPIGMSISELQPFEECITDAASIAGAYGVDSNLIPRKDNPTYSNLNTAELNVYNSVAMPELAAWLDGFNNFIGLYDAGYYIDALWDDVAILQENVQRREIAKTSISNRCANEFKSGLITLNDWRASIGKERVENELYDKTLIEMSADELENIKRIGL